MSRCCTTLALSFTTLVACSDAPLPCEGAACNTPPPAFCADTEQSHAELGCLGSARWSVRTGVNVDGDIALDAQGRLFVSATQTRDDLNFTPMLQAYSPQGEQLWSVEVGETGPSGFPSRPVLSPDQHIYVTIDRLLYSFTPEGRLDWVIDAPFGEDPSDLLVNLTTPPPSPTVGGDGTIYWQYMAATKPDGSLLWRQYVDPNTPCQSPVPARPDRVLFRGGDQLFALDEQGEPAWNLEKPYDLFTEEYCGMVPLDDQRVVTTWCDWGPSAFRCGHLVYVDLETGETLGHIEPPKKVAYGTTMVIGETGRIAMFSRGARGNPEDMARMWVVETDGTTSESVRFPWRGVYGAAAGNDRLIYLATHDGLAAVNWDGEMQWRFEPEFTVGDFSRAPALGSNGCVYYENFIQDTPRGPYDRKLYCIQGTATGLANSPWPRSFGGNHNGLRAP